MKNVLQLTLLLLFSFTLTLSAQYNTVDFESGGLGADWTWVIDANDSNPALEFVTNPDNAGINTSATAAKFTALQAGNPWALTYTDDIEEFQFDATNNMVTIMVYKTEISDVAVKFEGSSPAIELKQPNTLINQWETMTFDFSGQNGNTYNRLVIIPDFNLDGRTQDNILYFDNINIPTGNVAPPAEPMTAAPTPTHDEVNDNVLSIFSGAYTDVSGTDFNPNWGQLTISTQETVDSDLTVKYANLNYQGTQFAAAQDVSGHASFHLDFWTPNAAALEFYLISATSGERKYDLTITQNQWVSVDIPLSHFSGQGLDLTDIHQFKVVGNGLVWFDNWYFHGTGTPPAGPVEPTTVAATPMHSCVTSVLSDAYNNLSGTNFDPFWGQATNANVVMINGNEVLEYSGLNYQGTEFTAQDVSAYTHIHVDLWAASVANFDFYLISQTTGEIAYTLTSATEQWVGVDIPLSHFSGQGLGLTDIFQFKVTGAGNVWFDNLYFHSESNISTPVTGAVNTINCMPSCEGKDFTYYAPAGTPDEFYLAIDWDPNGTGANAAAKAGATVYINTLASPTSQDDGTDALWTMARYWNISSTAALVEPVSIRFYYDASEKTAIESAMNGDGRTAKGFQWFKTVGVDFDPTTHVTAQGLTGDAILLTDSNTGGLTESGILYAQFDGITSFSGGTGAAGVGAGALLPVELTYFRAEAQNEVVNLEWETSSEVNNDYFEVQRSVNGRDFYGIDQVAGAGNSSTALAYTARDKAPAQGANYYRLKQVDFDGSVQYSDIRLVEFKGNAGTASIFPNPTREQVNILFNTEVSKANVQVFDLAGRLVMSAVVSEGTLQHSLNLSSLEKGVYRLRIENNAVTETHSIVLY